MDHYLLNIWGGVEPRVFGPYLSCKTRNIAAKRRAKKENRDDNDYFKLSVTPRFVGGELTTIVSVAPFTGDELGRDD